MLRALTMLILSSLLLQGNAYGAASPRFAVLVGVGQYDPKTAVGGILVNADPDHNVNLKSPPNDLALITEVLSYYGFNASNTVVLPDAYATHDAITDAVNDHLLTLPESSLAVFYFSGHGSQLRGKDGHGEWNDETIVPYDGRVQGQPARDIIDDEIYGWIDQLSKRRITSVFILDSCYSGGMARVSGIEVKSLPATVEARPSRRGITSFRTGSVPNNGSAVVILTASGAGETAEGKIYNGRYQGVFTTALRNSLLPDGKSPPAVKWSEAIAQVVAELQPAPGERPSQTPQLYGTRDAPLFDSDGPFSNSFEARRLSVSRAILSVGSDLGVTKKSVFKLFGRGQVAWRSSDTFEALAQVTDITAQGATLDVLEPYRLTSNTLSAVEFQYAVPGARVRISIPAEGKVDPFDRQAIVAALGRLGEITDVAPELVLSTDGYGWQLATADGRSVGARVSAESSDALGILIGQRFADYARWQRLAAWKRPGVGGSGIEYRIGYETDSGTRMLNDDELQNAKIPAGATMRLLVENRTTQKVKVDALLLRPNFTVDVCAIGVPDRKEELATENVSVAPPPGPALWKIVVSDPAQNLSLLALRSEAGARSAIGSLSDEFASVWSGSTLSARGPPTGASFWRTIDVPFDVIAEAPGDATAPAAERRCVGDLPQKK